jgi:hypothetical protein
MSASSMVALVGNDGDHAPSSQEPRCQSLGDGFAYPSLPSPALPYPFFSSFAQNNSGSLKLYPDPTVSLSV